MGDAAFEANATEFVYAAARLLTLFVAAVPGTFMLLDALRVLPLSPSMSLVSLVEGGFGEDRYQMLSSRVGTTRSTFLATNGLLLHACTILVWTHPLLGLERLGGLVLLVVFLADAGFRHSIGDDVVLPLVAATTSSLLVLKPWAVAMAQARRARPHAE